MTLSIKQFSISYFLKLNVFKKQCILSGYTNLYTTECTFNLNIFIIPKFPKQLPLVAV